MRINVFLAKATGMSRRRADIIVESGRVRVNGNVAGSGVQVDETHDTVTLDDQTLTLPETTTTIILNKPVGYVCSRDGQGSKTIYELLPKELQNLKTVGRLDKDSSGLILLTDDGALAQKLTHPSFQKTKIYEIKLGGPLKALHRQMIADFGVQLSDGLSRFTLERIKDGDDRAWRVTMREGRNRQIRRTFAALGYQVTELRRTHFGPYALGNLQLGSWKAIA
ncbi:MAG TPA: pseudouridine synthase [Candidatus Saccharimonadales bacterium]